MEEITTQQTDQVNTLSNWWESISFQGKDQYDLRDNGELVLKSHGTQKERVIAQVTPENAESVMKALQDKFPEIEAKMKELEAEWDSTDDKQKVVGKVERMREYLKHTNAAGDFGSLFQPLEAMEKVIAELTEENYKQRLLITEEAEKIADSSNWKETTQKLKDLADQWKQVGHVDKHRNDGLWNRLEAARDKFFERKRQNHDDIEKDMLQNLDLKMELVDKAESLAASEDWKNTTERFRQLMEEWKKVGRTLPEKNELLWNKFINAKNVFFDRKRAHFETIQQEQDANYQLKIALVEKAEALKENTDWNATTQAYADLMEEWKKIGRVPLEKAEEIWARLNTAKDHFFQAKRHHFDSVKVSLEDNYAQKMALLKRAEVLQNSRQWREATVEMNELMDEWKKIGPVPRQHSNTIWEQFLAARKGFFERKDADRERRQENAERYRTVKDQQKRDFFYKLEEELREEQEKLEDFREGINNITPGHKEKELRQHLEKLIEQTEQKVKHKQEKLEELRSHMDKPESEKQATPPPDESTSDTEN